MKTQLDQFDRTANRRGERGLVAVIVMIALMIILVILVTVNVSTLGQLKQGLRLVERRQTRRLQTTATPAGARPVAVVPPRADAAAASRDGSH